MEANAWLNCPSNFKHFTQPVPHTKKRPNQDPTNASHGPGLASRTTPGASPSTTCCQPCLQPADPAISMMTSACTPALGHRMCGHTHMLYARGAHRAWSLLAWLLAHGLAHRLSTILVQNVFAVGRTLCAWSLLAFAQTHPQHAGLPAAIHPRMEDITKRSAHGRHGLSRCVQRPQ